MNKDEDLFNELENTEVTSTSRSRSRNTNPAQTKDYGLTDVDRRQKNLLQIYRNEPLVPVRIAPSYAKYFGRVMRVVINGVVVAVRCDGKSVEIPETFAAEVYRRIDNMDNYDLRVSNMSNVQRNFESAPGSLKFFG
jgi:hypothetical protein